MRIAFYAPMKPPDDPVPSGDRTMARAFVTALRQSGHTVDLASRLRLRLRTPDAERQQALVAAADAAVDEMARRWESAGAPDLWFTYHSYHKAPDLLGPALTRRFGLPYVLAEASHSARRADAWTSWFAAAERAVRAADLHICLTARDRSGLAPLLGPASRVLDLPPFLDLDGFPEPAPPRPGGPLRLIAVAMMRPGDKLDSYRFLAAGLATLGGLDWHLAIVGDGPARPAVAAAFDGLPSARIAWHGVLAPPDVRRCLADVQVFVWPGFGEAFGLCYLEAQAMGLPVVARDVAGVSSVVQADRTGLLVADAEPAAFGAAIATLARDTAQRERLGRQASAFVRTERTLATASGALDRALRALTDPCR